MRFPIARLVAAALLALYLILLARDDLDTAIPGGWKSAAALVTLLILGLLAYRGWRDRTRREAAGRWARGHALPLAVLGLTLAGGLLRAVGSGFGLPYLDHPDEPAVADRALHILQSGDFNPHYFIYPTLYTYLEAAVFVLRFFALVLSGAIERLDQIRPADFYLWGRLLTVLLGTLTIPVVYLAARRLYSPVVGLVAAGFLAFNSLHAQNSQFITVDVPVAFFCALALLAIAGLLPPRGEPARLAGPARYLAAGAAMGLAAGTKYQSVLIVLPFLLAHGYAVAATPGRPLGRFFGGRLWLALGALAGTFLLTTPFALFDLPHFLDDVASAIAHYRFGHQGFEGTDNWRAYVVQLVALDPWPTVLALAGAALAVLRHRRPDVLLVSFPAALYVTMSGYRVIFLHNLLPIVPFLAILAALALVVAWRALAGWVLAHRAVARPWIGRLAAAGLIAVLLLAVWPGGSAAAYHAYREALPDTRTQASRWLDAHGSAGTKLWMESALQLTPDRYLTTVGKHATDHPLSWYAAERFDYVILTAEGFKDVMDHPDHDPALHDAYVQFFQANAGLRAASIEPSPTGSMGPAIEIYRTGYRPPAGPADVHAGHPLAAVLAEGGANGGRVRLLGADYPDQVAAGSPLPLVLYWLDDAPLHADYTVFVHVINAAGDRPVQRDTGPRNGTVPTSTWHAGQVVVDEAGVDLPAKLPPGTYTLRVGMYEQSTGAALNVSGGPGNCPVCVVLGPVQVGPARP